MTKFFSRVSSLSIKQDWTQAIWTDGFKSPRKHLEYLREDVMPLHAAISHLLLSLSWLLRKSREWTLTCSLTRENKKRQLHLTPINLRYSWRTTLLISTWDQITNPKLHAIMMVTLMVVLMIQSSMVLIYRAPQTRLKTSSHLTWIASCKTSEVLPHQEFWSMDPLAR